MKTLSFLLIFTIPLLLAFSGPEYNQDTKKDYSQVETIQGILIFVYSRPVAQYEYIGTVKAGMTLTGTPEQLVNNLVKKAKKEYPTCEALIIASDLEKADVIKFK